MRLSEIMGKLSLASWPQLALIIFFVVFVAVVARVYSKRRKKEYEDASMLPLHDGTEPMHPREGVSPRAKTQDR